MRVLTFTACGQRYCCNLHSIVRVISIPELMQVPNMKPWMKGVMDYAGEQVSVVDLIQFFDVLMLPSYSMQTPVVIIENDRRKLGLIIDDLDGVHAVDESDFMPLTSSSTADALQQVLRMGDKTYMEIDAERLIDSVSRGVADVAA